MSAAYLAAPVTFSMPSSRFGDFPITAKSAADRSTAARLTLSAMAAPSANSAR